MVRPVYETNSDLEKEKRIITKAGVVLDFIWHKNPKTYYQIDYSLERQGKIFGMSEVKKRYHKYGTYPTLILSLNKWKSAMDYVRLGLAFYLIIEYDDGIFCLVIDEKNCPCFDVVWGGRTSATRDDGDIEPVVHIPIKDFFGLEICQLQE